MSGVTGLSVLLRAAARGGRWFWLTWVLVLWLTTLAVPGQYRTIVTDDPQGAMVAQTLAANPTMLAMLGPAYDLLNVGSFTMFRVGTFMVGMAGIMAVLGVVRATRAEEEDGRAELLRAGVVGRHAPLAAAVLLSLGAGLAWGALVAVSMLKYDPSVRGALTLGAGFAAGTAVFVGVGAVVSQISASARTARAVGLGALGAAYLVRALADGSPAGSGLRALQWVSPVEWPALARPYADERPVVLLLPVALTAGLLAVAWALQSRRDFGAGVVAARPGPARGARGLGSAHGLAWRLQRGTLLGWASGLGVFSLVVGSLSSTFDTAFKDDQALADRFRRMGADAPNLKDAFYVAMVGIVVVLVAVLALQVLGRLRREEQLGHAEVLLATATGRTSYALSHLLPALLVPVALLVACGAIFALPQGVSDSDPGVVLRIAGAALVMAPGVLLVVGLGMCCHGLLPRLSLVPWLVVSWSLLVNWVGALLNLPDRLLSATPFAPLPKLPVEPLTWTPVLVETGIAAVLVGLGLWGYARRDIGAGH